MKKFMIRHYYGFSIVMIGLLEAACLFLPQHFHAPIAYLLLFCLISINLNRNLTRMQKYLRRHSKGGNLT